MGGSTPPAPVPTGRPATEAEEEDGSPATSTLARTLRSLERELELAESRQPYVVIDVEQKRIRLLLHGVLLREFQALSTEIGTARGPLRAPGEAREVFDQVWRHGRTEPARERVRPVQIVDTADGSEPDPTPPIPPLPEEIYPTPRRFFLRLDGGLAVEFLPAGPEGRALRPGPGSWLSDLWAATQGSDRIRLRIVLSPEDQAELYRSLPDSCALLLRAD